MSIYEISNQTVKDIIKSFLMEIDANEEKELYRRIVFELSLAIHKVVGVDDRLNRTIDNYISELKEKSVFSSVLYTISSQIEYLNQREIKVLENQLAEIKRMIELHEKRDNISIF